MQKKYLVLFLLIIFSLSIFSKTYYTGINYTFRNTKYKNYLVLTSSIQRIVAIFNLESKKIEYYFDNVGFYPSISFLKDNKLLVIDTVGKKIILINIKTNQKNVKYFENKLMFYQRYNDIVYVLDTKGNIYGYDFNLNMVSYHKFLSSPNYFYIYKDYPLGLYVWREDFDVEYKDKLYNFNLITPTLVVDNYIIDTRGGTILDFITKITYKASPYISFALNWKGILYFSSMYSNEIYTLKNGKIVLWNKLKYSATNGKIINNNMYILSAPYNKLLKIDNNGNISIFETSKYPIDIFKHNNEIVVVGAENGEINIF
ncbi:hypothetical protein SU69_06610 [Thermosipho melanesiensis]|uniref:Uncharacterized protein n=2 Tax=Thermosipho melanesiensis TaxID=46541 RepID=A6LMK3_THEM4|nr:hypothetical protein [Thermosipho melanesiensis]ABR31154.1 hypothetical protein Tmel_1305 [Thermosipho melanesiensis BI429]APT74244.1 hypothetical protein BW47_06935 [Thermosipho melanesiensis]OOC36185.1 hypothetical protein SU68_06680 [Thermosipho melanesiensis]OOC37003.1 hypothetical protein SU69_06610 [Thermosipho melanesiensis]OOC37755.1 hypothetical protein SU70_06620 [Thermosipho melanesiensis]